MVMNEAVFARESCASVPFFRRFLAGDRYRIGFPRGGHWHEVFKSDMYDDYFNPNVQGNYGGVTADGPAWDELPTSANITLPANSVLVFASDTGDDPI